MPTTTRPILTKKLTKKVKKIKEIKIEVKKLPFKVGCDPEFLLFFGTRALDASHIIRKMFPDSSGPHKIVNVGELGWDGASSTAELRPVPTDEIQVMVNNIGKLLSSLNAKVPTVDLTTLSIGSPIGGHIHVDAYKPRTATTPYKGYNEDNRAEIKRIENLLATYLLPIAASDHRVSALTRLRNGGYGKLTDMRYERKGGTQSEPIITCEIRGLTAEWMTTPELAYATFAYIATIWHEFSIRNLELSKNTFVTRSQDQNSTLHRMMLSDYKILERGISQSIRKTIKTFALYPQYKKEIDFILRPELVMKHKEAVGWNINTGWKLNKTIKKPKYSDLMSKNKAINNLKKENIPDIQEHFNIAYNDDYNVQMFSSAIVERIVGLNWQLKNDYFLFGFKKSIKGYGAISPDGKFYAVPENESLAVTKDTLQRMQTRSDDNSKPRIDPKTGKLRGYIKNRKIAIGIPYNLRAEHNTQSIIDLIYKIENNKLEAKEISEFVVNNNKEETEPNILDMCENSRRNINYVADDILQIINQNN